MKQIKWIILITLIIVFSLGSQPAMTLEDTEEEHLISTIFFFTDIREALNEVMLQTGVNIIADDSVQGTVTLDLEEVPLEKALHMMLLSGGYSYRKFEDYYLVSMADPRSRNFKHLAETETVKLQYISANEAMSLLPSFYDAFLRSSDERDVITITATPEIIESFKLDLAKIDTQDGEVMIQVHVTEISTSLLRERGGDIFSFLRNEENLPEEDLYNLVYNRTGLGEDGEGFSYQFDQDFGTFTGRLKFLAQSEDVNIEANPRILVNDRSTANLFIGEEQVVFLESADARSRLERVNVGVEVEVTPKIIDDETIRMHINPRLSHFSEERSDRLVVKRNELDTTVFAKDGEALNLAGMTLDRETEFTSAVPILGSIPIIRWLFREETERNSERELIIFLTPEIVRK